MMKYLLIVLMVFSLSAHAEKKNDKKIEAKDFSVLGKIDEETYKKIDESKQLGPEAIAVEANANSRVTMSCKDTAGKEFKKGEAGYENCLMNLKNQYDVNKGNSRSNNKDQNNGNSANFNFKVGN